MCKNKHDLLNQLFLINTTKNNQKIKETVMKRNEKLRIKSNQGYATENLYTKNLKNKG